MYTLIAVVVILLCILKVVFYTLFEWKCDLVNVRGCYGLDFDEPKSVFIILGTIFASTSFFGVFICMLMNSPLVFIFLICGFISFTYFYCYFKEKNFYNWYKSLKKGKKVE